jgi:hypothetical protein
MLMLAKEVAAVVLGTDNFGQYADDVMLCAAVWIGHAESRPMTAAKIAAYIGMPRPSVVRKLAGLQKRGIVQQGDKGQWRMVPRDEYASMNDASKSHIHRAASNLSILDAQPIADRFQS